MKYKIGQTVVLLNTEFKPAGYAIIVDLNPGTHQYQVEYKVSGSQIKGKFWVFQERLTLIS